MCISHVYQIQITYNVLLSYLKRNLLYDTCVCGTSARFFIFTALFWPVNRKLSVKRSCYRLSKANRSAGKFDQTTKFCALIYLSGFCSRP